MLMNQDASQVLLSSAPKIQLTMVGGLVARHLCDTAGCSRTTLDTAGWPSEYLPPQLQP